MQLSQLWKYQITLIKALFSGMYETQLAVTVCFSILNHWFSAAAQKTRVCHLLAVRGAHPSTLPMSQLGGSSGLLALAAVGSQGDGEGSGSSVKEVPS